MTGSDPRAGFTLVEVLAALVITGAIVAVVLPYAARLATHWWIGETTVEAADGWMQAIGRMSDDLAEAVPYGLGPEGATRSAFSAGPDGLAFARPALGGGGGLEAVRYEVRPSAAGQSLVRLSRRFDPETFDQGGGAPAVLLDGPFTFRIVEVARDGTRRRNWSAADGMPAAVELSATASGRAALPVAPVLMAVVARAPAAAKAAAGTDRP